MTEPIGPNTPVGVAARELLSEAMGDVVRRLRALVRRGPRSADRVHSFRVATRRASAAIRLFEHLIDPEQAEHTKRGLRRLRRAAGRVREGDVHLEILRSGLNGRLDPDSRHLRRLIKDAKRRRRKARKSFEKRLTRRALRRMRRAAASVVDSVRSEPESLGSMASLWISAAVPRILETGNLAAADRDEFHRARIEFKRIRYSMDLLSTCYPRAATDAVLVWLADVQDRMGAVNDLSEMVEMLSPEQAPEDGPLAGIQRTLRAECNETYTRFAEWWRTSGRAEFARVIRPIVSAPGVTEPPVVARRLVRPMGGTLVVATGAPGETRQP